MGFNQFCKAKISGVSYIVPSNCPKHIDDYIYLFDNNIKKLERNKKIMGYGNTYLSPAGLTSVDICEVAANNLLSNLSIDRHSVDALIFVSQFADYITPPSSQILHSRLNLSKQCFVYDLLQGCTGYIYGLWNAFSLIESGAANRILLLCGDSLPAHFSSENKKGGNLIFSSAGSATLVERSNTESISSFLIETDGSKYESIIIPAGGARLPITSDILNLKISDKDGNIWQLNESFIDGLSVFDFSIKDVPQHILSLFDYTKLTIDDIDFFAIHQANKQIIDAIMSVIGVPDNKYSTKTFTKYGNHSCSSVLSNLIHVYGESISKRKSHIAMTSFGSGLSLASCILDIENIYSSGIILHNFKDIETPADVLQYWANKISNYSAR